MRRDRLEHVQVRTARKPEPLVAAPREGQRALRVGPLGGQLIRHACLDHDRGAIDGHPETAEAPLAVAGDRKHAQVQARRRLDTDGQGSPTAARRWRAT